MAPARLRWAAEAALAAGVLGAYARTAYPSMPGGDSGELVAEACQLGTPHPPGYPLNTLLLGAVLRATVRRAHGDMHSRMRSCANLSAHRSARCRGAAHCARPPRGGGLGVGLWVACVCVGIWESRPTRLCHEDRF